MAYLFAALRHPKIRDVRHERRKRPRARKASNRSNRNEVSAAAGFSSLPAATSPAVARAGSVSPHGGFDAGGGFRVRDVVCAESRAILGRRRPLYNDDRGLQASAI